MKARLTMVAARYGDVAPQATVCCNACRSCVQSNVLAAVTAAALAVIGRLRRSER
jgi:hypothetical protein